MAKIIQVSFKGSEEELYQEVTARSSKSGFMKDCLRYYLEDTKRDKLLPFEPIK